MRFNQLLFAFILLFQGISNPGMAENPELPDPGKISGIIVDSSDSAPIEMVNVVLRKTGNDNFYMGTVTDKDGKFSFEKVPPGEYKVVFSLIGFENNETSPFTIKQGSNVVSLGKLIIRETSVELGEVGVVAQRSTYVNSIDRKTFNVGQDLTSKSGTLSDLLQNIPSVQVDIEGNVSLRGSENVTVLVNGRTSSMMNLNRAAILQQIPAGSIEKIEVITNPSAKYKPDGTSGIINVVMKKGSNQGLNGIVTANAGNEGRYNGNLSMNYNPGRINFSANIGYRHDDRQRIGNSSTKMFSNGLETNSVVSSSKTEAHPESVIGNLGVDFKISDQDKISIGTNYDHRFQRQKEIRKYVMVRNGSSILDYNRDRILPELETDLEYNGMYQHLFKKEGHEFDLSFTTSKSHDNEDNYYTNTYNIPASRVQLDNMFYRHVNSETQFLAEYTNPLSSHSKLEAGYELNAFSHDMDLHRDTTAVNQNTFTQDISRSSHFARSENTQAVYVTFEHESGKFGFLVGLRGEYTSTNADLVTTHTVVKSDYSRLYPTFHSTYKISETSGLQLNYSHRINRPEDEDMNPFPEYQDMLNLRAGNPYLKPEDIHSFEFGYQYKRNTTTFISTLYYRYNYNGITSITQVHGDTLINTLQNLEKNSSAGLEFILDANLGRKASLSLSSNTFYNVIDATSLGFSNHKADISFMINASLNMNITKSTLWQITSNYSGERLTPQGKRLPSFVMNTGLKQEILKRKGAILFTVSDIFNSLTSNSEIDTPNLQKTDRSRRSVRTIFIGLTYNFGSNGKKQKESNLKYDNQM